MWPFVSGFFHWACFWGLFLYHYFCSTYFSVVLILFMAEKYVIVWINQTTLHFVYPFISWWIDCVSFLAVRLLLCTNFPVHSWNGIARMYRILSWAFWGIASLLSTMVAPFYIPTSNTRGLQFLRILTSNCCCLSFWLYPFCWMSGGISLFRIAFP